MDQGLANGYRPMGKVVDGAVNVSRGHHGGKPLTDKVEGLFEVLFEVLVPGIRGRDLPIGNTPLLVITG